MSAVRAYHVFTPRIDANLGRTWDAELPILEREFATADSPSALTTAIGHFVNSLHNPHCWYNAPQRPVALTPGFVLEAEWTGSSAKFFVSEVLEGASQGKPKVGDELVSVDGVPARELLEQLRFESSANNWRGIAHDVAEWLSSPRTWTSTKEEGGTSDWVFAPRDGGNPYPVRTTYVRRTRSEGRRSEHAIAYDGDDCLGRPPRRYGPYELRSRGVNVCLYTSRDPRFRDFPIVRQVSFDYGSTSLVRADYHALKEALGALPRARGVILDLRDNGGGNNPNWFMDWWAAGPYVDRMVRLRLVDDLAGEGKLERVNALGEHAATYLRALAARAPGQSFTRDEPFFCRTAACDDDNRYVPKHRVTEAPVALLVGPGCVSSCDSLAQLFDENDFGPLIGEPTAVGYTAFRYRHDIRTERGEDLGFATLALSFEVSGKTKEPLEAAPLHLDYPVDRTVANRSSYDALLVERALEAFGAFRFPRPVAP